MRDNLYYESTLPKFKTRTKIYGKNGLSGIKYLDKGNIKLMCPNCYNLHDADICIKVEGMINSECTNISLCSDYKIYGECKYCGITDDFVILDPNIAPAISIFNKKGFTTKFCCEGHGKEFPYVYFKSALIRSFIHTLPDTWHYNKNDFNGSRIEGPIRDWKEAIFDLILWAESLPNMIKKVTSRI